MGENKKHCITRLREVLEDYLDTDHVEVGTRAHISKIMDAVLRVMVSHWTFQRWLLQLTSRSCTLSISLLESRPGSVSFVGLATSLLEVCPNLAAARHSTICTVNEKLGLARYAEKYKTATHHMSKGTCSLVTARST